MLEAWILNRLFIFALGFFVALKLVSTTLGVDMSIEFLDGNDERFKGVVWIGLSGIPIQVECA
jgi:hypothetical protein